MGALMTSTAQNAKVALELCFCFITAEKGGVAKAKGEGEKEKECTTECKSRRRRDEKSPWAINYESHLLLLHASSRMKRRMIPTDLHRSGSSPHPAGRRQGDEDERYSAAVDGDGIGLGSHRSVASTGRCCVLGGSPSIFTSKDHHHLLLLLLTA